MDRFHLLPAFALLGALSAAGAQDAPKPLFADATPLQLTIEGPFRQLSRDDGDERPEHPAIVRFVDAEGQPVALDIEIRIRGKSRLEICDFPPLSLDFPRGALEGTVFAGQNRLKLVTLCQRKDDYRDYLGHEFQVYRLFNALTDRSFRVRWATIEYIWTDSRRPESFTEPGFLIEEDWEVAERHGMNVIEVDSLSLDALDGPHTALLSVFQYMIGNTDWSTIRGPEGETCCHNGDLIGPETGGAIMLPYDFDQAGFIDTEYALPNEQLRIRNVRQRLYRGFCALSAELDAAIAHISAQRAAMEAVLDDERVGIRARQQALDYLSESFAILNDPERRQTEIVDACRG